MKRTAALLGLLPPLVVGLAGTAYADAPAKTGWWNAASANGFALPMPTTGADNLHVGQGPNGPTAYAAVAYPVALQGVSGGTLQLKVAPSSKVGTIDVVACPTRSTAWKAGGNQPLDDSAPDYDCTHGVQGVAAADGASVSFLLDTAQLTDGFGFSVAIAPSADAKPFDVDFVKPDATSLTPEVDPGYTEPSTDTAAAPPPAYTAPAPPAAGVSGTVPLTAGTVPAPVAPVAAQVPVVAAAAAPAPRAAPAAVAPVAASRPLPPDSKRERYIAGSMLALLSGFLVWAFQQQSPQPRLIGGVARKAGPVAVPVVDARPRGIGRFAALRTTPARPLV